MSQCFVFVSVEFGGKSALRRPMMKGNAMRSEESKQKIAFIGVGAMGGVMVPHLKDFGDIAIYDTNLERATEVASSIGATVTDSLSEVAGADIVILMLPDSSIIDPFLRGTDSDPGLLTVMEPGSLVIDMSSSAPTSTIKNGSVAADRGIKFMDAPVSGGTAGASAATLSIMVGGAIEDFAAAEPLLGKMGKNVVYVGEIGSGHALKCLNNILAATCFQATAEVFTAGKKFGLDPNIMVEVMKNSSGSNFTLFNGFPDQVLTGKYDFGFQLKLMEKDVRLAMSLFEATGAPTQVVSRVADVYANALKIAEPGSDYTIVALQNDVLGDAD